MTCVDAGELQLLLMVAAINEPLLPLANDRSAATIPSDRFCM
jgi:hypothetical protein